MFIDNYVLRKLCTYCFKSQRNYRTSTLIQTASKGIQTDRIASRSGTVQSLEKSIQTDNLADKQASTEESHGEYIVVTKATLRQSL